MITEEQYGDGSMMESMTVGIGDDIEISVNKFSSPGMAEVYSGSDRPTIERCSGRVYGEGPSDNILCPITVGRNPFFDDPEAIVYDDVPEAEPPKVSCQEVQAYLDLVLAVSSEVVRPDILDEDEPEDVEKKMAVLGGLHMEKVLQYG